MMNHAVTNKEVNHLNTRQRWYSDSYVWLVRDQAWVSFWLYLTREQKLFDITAVYNKLGPQFILVWLGNQAWIFTCNQPVLNNEGSFLLKETMGAFDGVQTHDWPKTSQTRYLLPLLFPWPKTITLIAHHSEGNIFFIFFGNVTTSFILIF